MMHITKRYISIQLGIFLYKQFSYATCHPVIDSEVWSILQPEKNVVAIFHSQSESIDVVFGNEMHVNSFSFPFFVYVYKLG